MSPKRLPVSGFFLLIIVLFLSSASFSRADEVQLKPDHPERYTVVRGDTLWDISARFLKSPWMWPKIWKINQEIKNPHLIYPGDVIVFRMVDGKPELSVLRKETVTAPGLPSLPESAQEREPAATARPTDERTVKLQPQVHSEGLDAAIPTIPPNAIMPFLTRPLVVGENELEEAGYITTGLDDRIARGNGSQFYASRMQGETEEF